MSAGQEQQAGAVTTEEAQSFLDNIIAGTRAKGDREKEAAKSAIDAFVSQVVQPGMLVSKDVEKNIEHWIQEIDKKLSAQLREIMHTPEFQKLEGTWRGLDYLVKNSETGTELKIRVLNVQKKELFKDLEKAVEFDMSTVFKHIYTAEYGQLGGTPYGMLVGDYDFTRHPEDVKLLGMMSNVAAASHAPFITAAGAGMFNLNSYTELSNPRDLAKIFDSVDYAAWKSFRESEDSRFVALTMPRVLARLPYSKDFTSVEEFNYEEGVDGRNHDDYCWMNSAWAYAARVTDSYSKHGWMMTTRGVQGGGKVEGLPVHTFVSDDGDVTMQCPTEVPIPDRREYELSNLGFLPLLHSKNSDFAAFLGAQSCQKPKTYFDPDANANAELSAKINLIMCVSRFAHYLKVMARDKIGSMMEADECEKWLNDWIQNYVASDPTMLGEEGKAKFPLKEARVEVREVKGRPGHYNAVAYLRPHFQMEKLDASLRLVANVPKRA